MKLTRYSHSEPSAQVPKDEDMTEWMLKYRFNSCNMAITGPTSCAQALPPSFKDVIALCGQSKFSTVQSVGSISK